MAVEVRACPREGVELEGGSRFDWKKEFPR
jgi:hypothetical protein